MYKNIPIIKCIGLQNFYGQYFYCGEIPAGFTYNRYFSQAFPAIYAFLKFPYAVTVLLPVKNDVVRMQELKAIREYKNVVDFMIKNNAKLEQEIVSLRLMGIQGLNCVLN